MRPSVAEPPPYLTKFEGSSPPPRAKVELETLKFTPVAIGYSPPSRPWEHAAVLKRPGLEHYTLLLSGRVEF